jgi:hypothetical protein
MMRVCNSLNAIAAHIGTEYHMYSAWMIALLRLSAGSTCLLVSFEAIWMRSITPFHKASTIAIR